MTDIAKPKKLAASRAHKPGRKAAGAGASAEVMGSAAPGTFEPTGRDVLVPLDQLFISDANVRKVHHAEGLSELAALIEAQGLLQRLSVVAHPEGRYAVVAGGRRLRAMQMLAESGRWSATQPVECRLCEAEQALQVSLAENSGREGMLDLVLESVLPVIRWSWASVNLSRNFLRRAPGQACPGARRPAGWGPR